MMNDNAHYGTSCAAVQRPGLPFTNVSQRQSDRPWNQEPSYLLWFTWLILARVPQTPPGMPPLPWYPQ